MVDKYANNTEIGPEWIIYLNFYQTILKIQGSQVKKLPKICGNLIEYVKERFVNGIFECRGTTTTRTATVGSLASKNLNSQFLKKLKLSN